MLMCRNGSPFELLRCRIVSRPDVVDQGRRRNHYGDSGEVAVLSGVAVAGVGGGASGRNLRTNPSSPPAFVPPGSPLV